MELNKINSTGSWGNVAEDINQNFSKVNNAVEQVKNATTRNKGYFSTEADLKSAFTTANVGDIAYVGGAYPYKIWKWNGSAWADSGQYGGDEQVNLGNYYTKAEADEKVDELAEETEAKLSELASEVETISHLKFKRGNLQNNGQILDSTTRIYANKIRYKGDIVVVKGWLISSVAYYNESDGSFNEYVIVNNSIYNLGKNGCYATIVLRKEDDSDIDENSYAPSSAMAFSVLELSKVADVQEKEISRADGRLRYLHSLSSSNVCSNSVEHPGCIVRGSNGAIEESECYNTSEMFPIAPSTTYIKSNLTFLAFYDSNKQYISREENKSGTSFVTPSNAYYARVSSNVSPNLWQLNMGDTLLEYEYPTSVIPNILDISHLVFKSGNLVSNGTITSSEKRIYTENVKFNGFISVANGWLISTVAYYNESDGSFNEYVIVNNSIYNLGKNGCYATIVLRKEDDSKIDESSYAPSSAMASSVLELLREEEKECTLVLEYGGLDANGGILYCREEDVENYYKFLRTEKYIELEELKDFLVTLPSGYSIRFFAYDSNCAFIGTFENIDRIPKKSKYCKILIAKGYIKEVKSSNVCSNSVEHPGCIVRGSNGAIEESECYNTSEMFPIAPSTTYIKSNLTFLAFYDSNKQYISREENKSGTSFVTPSNAYYARVSSNVSPNLWQLNMGDTLLEYECPIGFFVPGGEIEEIPNVTIRYRGKLSYCCENVPILQFNKIIYGISHSVNRCESLDEATLQDAFNRDVDYANIMLPPNYSVDGAPVRLAYFCHGSNGIGWGGTLCGGYYDLCRYVAKEGYAIMEIFGISYKYRDEATDNIGLPIAMTSFVESYKWAKSHLNIKYDGVVVWGKSAGGGPIGNLLYQKQIPILAVAGLAPISDIYNEIFRNRDAKAKKFYADQLGFEGEFEWADRPVGSEQQQLEFQYLLQNADKGIGSNPVWNGIIDLDTKALLQESFKNPYNNFSGEYPEERALYESKPKFISIPYKVWIARDDRNVDPRHYDYWVKMARKTGSYYELRYLPEGTGAHNAVDTAENALKSSVKPKYSDEILEIPIAYIEMITWWRRFGG